MTAHTIKMDNKTTRFYQGVTAATKVLDEHADVEFPDQQTRVSVFWFYAGALAAGEYGCETADDFALFVQGATTRAPRVETEEV
jgi:hypothetical protein